MNHISANKTLSFFFKESTGIKDFIYVAIDKINDYIISSTTTSTKIDSFKVIWNKQIARKVISNKVVAVKYLKKVFIVKYYDSTYLK